MSKKKRYDNVSFGSQILAAFKYFNALTRYSFFILGKGLFARKDIPANTVLAFYPGDRISAEEMENRSSNRFEADRFVFSINSDEL